MNSVNNVNYEQRKQRKQSKPIYKNDLNQYFLFIK